MLSSSLLGWLTNDQQLMALLAHNWMWGTLLIALVIFVETGLVIMPLLPGDTLLFATGTFLGISGISPFAAIAILALAAILGDGVNFSIGRSRVGNWLLQRGWVKPIYIAKTQEYFDRYGGFTIFVGRFIPIVRTIAPFMAGLSGMRPGRFFLFNILGGITWCTAMVLAGVWLGSMPWVKAHVSLITLSIAVLSVLPMLLHLIPFLLKSRADVSENPAS